MFRKHALIRKEMIEMVRTSRLVIWIVFCGFFGIASPLTAYYMPDILSMVGATENIVINIGNITYGDALEQYTKNFSQIGTIVLILISMGAVAAEKADGSIQFLLVRPVGHMAIVGAKLATLATMLLIGIATSTLAMGFYTWYLFPGFPVLPFVVSNIFLLLYFFTIGSVAIAISTMVDKPILAGVGALGIWLLSSLAGMVRPLGDFSFVKLVDQVVQTVEGFPFEWEPTAGAVLLMLVTMSLGIMSFKRWEPAD